MTHFGNQEEAELRKVHFHYLSSFSQSNSNLGDFSVQAGRIPFWILPLQQNLSSLLSSPVCLPCFILPPPFNSQKRSYSQGHPRSFKCLPTSTVPPLKLWAVSQSTLFSGQWRFFSPSFSFLQSQTCLHKPCCARSLALSLSLSHRLYCRGCCSMTFF